MKKLLTFIAMAVFAIGMQAIPAKRGIWRTVKLEDGTSLRVELRGNEYMHYWQSEDGRYFFHQQDGAYVEKTKEELTDQGWANRARAKGANGPLRSHYSSTADGLGEYGKSALGSVGSIGEVTIPVILVEFADVEFQPENTIEKMNSFFNEEGYVENRYCAGSARDFFIAQSYGKFKPSFPVVAKVKLTKNYAEYGANDNEGHDKNVMSLVREAIVAAVNQGVDFSQYYKDNNVQLVSCIYAGRGEASGGDENTIWPHQLDLPSYSTLLGGYKFKSYFVGNEISMTGAIEGIGTFCHEFGHGLGLPDFYCTDYSYDNESAFGNWSTMDSGCYINQGYTPAGYTAYERSYLGWLSIPEITSPQGVVLGDPDVEGSVPAVLYRNPSNSKEYFIFENKQPGAWYASEMGSGLFVSRIAYSKDQWQYNTLNNKKDAKRAMAVTADNAKLYYTATQSNLYGNALVNKATWTYFNKTECTTVPIYKVMKHSNRTVSFNIMGNDMSYTYKPTEGTTYELVNNADDLADGDIIILANVEDAIAMGGTQTTEARIGVCVNPLEGGKLIAEDNIQEIVLKRTANGYWAFQVGDVYLTSATSGSKLVGTNKPGTNAMASIDINDGNAVITFQVKNNANKNLRYNTESTLFTCYDTEGAPVQIYRKAADQNAIQTIAAGKTAPVRKGAYTLTGQQEDRNHLGKGIHIIDGKKVLVK